MSQIVRFNRVWVTAPLEDEPASLQPPFRWTRRLLIALALIIGLLLIFRWQWLRYEENDLNGVLADLHRQGVRLTEAELFPESIPDDQNAVPLLHHAAELSRTVQLSSDFWTFENQDMYWLHGDLSAAAQRELESVVRSSRPFLAEVRQARQRGRIRWRTRPENSGNVLAVNDVRTPYDYVRWAMAYANASGDRAETLECALDIGFLARAARAYPDDWATFVGDGIDEGLCASLANAALSPRWPSKRDSAKQLINELLIDPPEVCWEGGIQRTSTLLQSGNWTGDQSDAGDAGGLAVVISNWLSRPFATRIARESIQSDNYCRLIFHSADVTEAAAVPVPPVRRRKGLPRGVLSPVEPAHCLMNTAFEPLVPPSWIWAKSKAFSRATALVLAISLYRADHEGACPTTLDDLVPHYLPAVPFDPLARTRRPFLYMQLPDGSAFIGNNVGGKLGATPTTMTAPSNFNSRKTWQQDGIIWIAPPRK